MNDMRYVITVRAWSLAVAGTTLANNHDSHGVPPLPSHLQISPEELQPFIAIPYPVVRTGPSTRLGTDNKVVWLVSVTSLGSGVRE